MNDPYQRMIEFKKKKLSQMNDLDVGNIAENVNRVQFLNEGLLRRRNVPTSLLIQNQKEMEMQAGNAMNQYLQPQMMQQQAQRSAAQEDIINLQSKQDEYRRAKEEEKKQKKQDRDKMWTKIAGTVGGAAIGTLIAPGIGTAYGASIGSGVGDVAAGLGVGAGKIGSEELIDEGLIAQGLANTASATLSAAKSVQAKNLAGLIGENADLIAGLSNEQATTLNMLTETAKLTGDTTELEAFLAALK
jgi:uncharacterized protein YcfJ